MKRTISESYASSCKPDDCRYCYYYAGKKKGCSRETCFYVQPVRTAPAVTKCTDCPYGRASPCIGWCTKDVLAYFRRGGG